jgi:hypothetical protein
MWIMLTKKLQTNPSPPKLSIFWSTPWPKESIVKQQFKRFSDVDAGFNLDKDGHKLDSGLLSQKIQAFMETQGDLLYDLDSGMLTGFGAESNWAKARKIEYKGETIRVFSNEFTAVTHENMALYIGCSDPDQASHELITSTVAENKLMNEVLEGDLREVYDAALVDGCSHSQAVGMALGIDISETVDNSTQLAQFPLMGWYRCKPEYAQVYCYEHEMVE